MEKTADMKNVFIFVQEIIRKPLEVGAIAPSSKALGEAITKYIKSYNEPIHVVEVGPGTGVFTKIIASKLRPKDRLDVIEFNQQFVDILKENFKDFPNVRVHCASIIDWNPNYRYDFMVSSLPLNAFSAEFVKSIMEHYEKIMKPGGIISYFEYLVFPELKKLFLIPAHRADYKKMHTLLDEYRKKYEIDTVKVYKNLPPAIIHNLKMPGNRS
jgi:phosphatidylethanolamine/phosphatidyl-N-methylethanolamine N-methyltransferase